MRAGGQNQVSGESYKKLGARLLVERATQRFAIGKSALENVAVGEPKGALATEAVGVPLALVASSRTLPGAMPAAQALLPVAFKDRALVGLVHQVPTT